MTVPTPIRVLVAEDDPSMRYTVEELIRSEKGLELVAAAGDAASAVEAAKREQPDVALIDVRMPGGGASAARGIRSCSAGTRVLAYTAHVDRETVLEMLDAGAIGYVLKGDSIEELVDAIQRSAAGQAPLSAEIAGDVIKELRGQLGVHRRAASQTQRSEKRISAALEEGAFSMVFQPIFSLAGPMVGAEALARFRGPPKRGPEVWFAEAEEVGLRRDLELAALKAGLAALPQLPADIYLSLNASPNTLLSADFRTLVLEDSDPKRIVIEVTEHAEIDDYDRLNSAFDRVREQGVRLAVDDAGAGFASLRHILRLAPDFIKLDRTLVEGIESDRSRQALAVGLISFAKRIDAAIIAEGIEQVAEVDMLASLGVDYGQGYFLARPGPLPLPSAAQPDFELHRSVAS